jgi:hypothetical protein
MGHGVGVCWPVNMCDRVQAERRKLGRLPTAFRPPDTGAVQRFNLDPLRVTYSPKGAIKKFGVHDLVQFLG